VVRGKAAVGKPAMWPASLMTSWPYSGPSASFLGNWPADFPSGQRPICQFTWAASAPSRIRPVCLVARRGAA
jgi:hypothetical protein